MSALGGAIEVAQGTMGLGRDMDIHDWIADTGGVLIALAILLTCVPRRRGSWLRWVESLIGRIDVTAESSASSAALRPLADRMRPRNLEEFVGQPHLLAPGKPLRQALEGGRLHSMVLWGPPGTGKTTLARLIAGTRRRRSSWRSRR